MASTKQMQERAKARKAAEKLAAKYENLLLTIDVTQDTSGKGNSNITFNDFLDIAAKHGWTKGYKAPYNHDMNNEILALARLANHRKMHAELAKHDGFDYRGGVADLVGGALLRASNPKLNEVFVLFS